MTMRAEQPESVVVPRKAVQRLILAADSYGVRYLDSDDLSDEAQELQDATEAMKDLLAAAPRQPQGAEVVGDPWYGDRDQHEVDQAYGEYDGTSCHLCGRERVMLGGATGKRICEKCGTYQDATPQPVQPAPVGREAYGGHPTLGEWLDAIEAVHGRRGRGAEAQTIIGLSRRELEALFLAALSQPAPEAGEATGAQAIIRDGQIVISIDVDALPLILSGSIATNSVAGTFKVTDPAIFAKEVCHSLNDEKEDGTTRVHMMFDSAFNHAIDQGAEGIEEITEDEFEVEAARLRAALSPVAGGGDPTQR